jgi:hypothetical protein
VKLLLDGQQQLTSLDRLLLGRSAKFFDGDDRLFIGLYSNIKDELQHQGRAI